MKVLRRVRPSPEQIGIIRRIQTGASLIRGAAGSGKTTTALVALRATTGATVNQLRNDGRLPANVVVLTYYNSLKGYIKTVAEDELSDYADNIRLFISTFDKWAYDSLGWCGGVQAGQCEHRLYELSAPFPRDTRFTIDEVSYVLGRFLPDDLDAYLTAERTGRGISPQMPRQMRERLLNEVIHPYLIWKGATGNRDFHDLAIAMQQLAPTFTYDVVVVDEAQDLTANQLRAILRHTSVDATITVVTDSAQRIYPRVAVWSEAGLLIPPNRSFRLANNYRNTRQIAALAASLAHGLRIDDDGSLPDPAACLRDGPMPILVRGTFHEQLGFVMDRLAQIDLDRQTVGFLHLKGGGWFDAIRGTLRNQGYDFCELQGVSEWPEDGPNIGLCTFHSAKGLEFDHVFMIGLAAAHASYGDDPDDDRLDAHRRLVAMGVGRARETIVIGGKPGEELPILATVDPATFQEVIL